jgi:hypothetical protein
LKGVEAEIGEVGDLFPGRPDAEDATRILGAGSLGVKVVAQPAIASGHLPLPLLDWPGGVGGQLRVVGRDRRRLTVYANPSRYRQSRFGC